jgi:predicted ATPase
MTRSTRLLHPAPQSETAASLIVRAAFSRQAVAGLCRACRDATGGNPLLLRMLAHALRAEGADHTAQGEERVAELAPQVVAASVLPRLRRLPADAEALAGAVAVPGDKAELRHAAALAGIETGPAALAADALAAGEIFAQGRPIDFVHPTVRRAVYESLPAGQRHRAHRQAALILEREGAPAERIAAHLVVAERMGDDWVVGILRAATREALASGAVDEAMRYLRRALEEPPHPAVRVGYAQRTDGHATTAKWLASGEAA